MAALKPPSQGWTSFELHIISHYSLRQMYCVKFTTLVKTECRHQQVEYFSRLLLYIIVLPISTVFYAQLHLRSFIILNAFRKVCFKKWDYAVLPDPMSQKPVSIWGQRFSLARILQDQHRLTFVACMNIPTSSSILLGDCKTACLSIKADPTSTAST